MNQKLKLQEKINKDLPDLIKKYIGGDSSVEDEIAVLLLPYVRLIINKYKNSINDDLDSLAGIITTRIIKKIHNIDLNKSFIGYISRSTINYCIDIYRKFKRTPEKKVISYEDYASYDVDTSSSFDVDSIKELLHERFSREDARILSYYYIEGLAIDQISSLTGQSHNSIQETVTLAQEFI